MDETTFSRLCIGIISDTHGLLRPQAVAALAGSDAILHAGDIGTPDILAALSAIAPVVAVRGNNDRGAWADEIPEHRSIELGGVRIHLLHDVKALDPSAAGGCEVVVAGHSHKPGVERRGGVLFVNPGSAGPRRFKLPVSVARLVIGAAGVEAGIIELHP